MPYRKLCVCEYDGTNYCGWQIQDEGVTIQGEIERVLSQLYGGQRVAIIGSGRTDSGVHALGQVFHYTADIYRENHSVLFALNTMLSRDIGVLDVRDVPLDFHAQLSAVSKTYKYVILNRRTRAALDTNRAWYRRDRLDVEYIANLLKLIEGNHDFTSFCVKSSVKEECVRLINWTSAERNGDYINIKINANGFLHNMVRIIVGTAVQFAVEKRTPSDILDIIAAKARRSAGITAPPQGLYLERVHYE
ncbi:tRNA pseudouridine(38-40) synthase TruA [Deferribacterales bacterium RsTz2092]|nr:tRNA pseudouridine synthase A [Deferribacterales bacterium]